ncbi:hypothetical protein BC835DRAFT_1310280 [Cytidiella melzeri]|nr:hypothetical protein BC835DRAFT_1310280 [Cytidiella melzeri]
MARASAIRRAAQFSGISTSNRAEDSSSESRESSDGSRESSDVSREFSSESRGSSEPEHVGPIVVQPSIGQKRRNPPVDGNNIMTRRVMQRTHLSNRNQEVFTAWTKMSVTEQRYQAHADILKLHERLDIIQPADAPFMIKEKGELKTQIEKYKTVIMTSPNTPGYMHDVPRLLLETIARHPSWGVTAAIYNSPPKLLVVSKYVRRRCTESRKDIKKMIKLSIGESDPQNPDGQRLKAIDIVTLVKNCIGNSKKDIVVTAPMCARFAFLRQVFCQAGGGADFWPNVDDGLQTVREAFAGTPNEKEDTANNLNRVFLTTLNDDLRIYGHPSDQRGFANTSATEIQREVEATALAAPILPEQDDSDNSEDHDNEDEECAQSEEC